MGTRWHHLSEIVVPDNPIIPLIRRDSTGVDSRSSHRSNFDPAIARGSEGKKKIEWFKVYAGDKVRDLYGTHQYLPQDTLMAIEEYGIAIFKVPF